VTGNPERPLPSIDTAGIGRPVFLPDGKHVFHTHGLRPVGQIVDGIMRRAVDQRYYLGQRESLQKQLEDFLDFTTGYWRRRGKRPTKGDILELAEEYQCDPMDIKRLLWPKKYGRLHPDDLPPLLILELAEDAEMVPDEGDELPAELVEWLRGKRKEILERASF